MRIDILSAVPELLESPLNYSIVKRAKDKGLVDIHIHNIRDYGLGNYRQIDDYAYGGDAGMVMMVEPIFNIIDKLKKERHYDEVIYTSPDGHILDQACANHLSCLENIIILCDAVVRLIPRALGDETSALSDSFQDELLSPPIYTRPADFNGWKVPDVLLSGNPKLIKAWQDEQALERTRKLRPGLLKKN